MSNLFDPQPGTIWKANNARIVVKIVAGPFCPISPVYGRYGENGRYARIHPTHLQPEATEHVSFSPGPCIAYRYLICHNQKLMGTVTHALHYKFLESFSRVD